MRELMRLYLLREEGLTNLTNEELDMNIKAGIDVFGSESTLRHVLETYNREDLCTE